MRFGITMDNLNLDNVQLDLDTLLRLYAPMHLMILTYHKLLLPPVLKAYLIKLNRLVLLVEFTPEKSDLLGINFTSISTEVSDKCIKNLNKFIDLFTKRKC